MIGDDPDKNGVDKTFADFEQVNWRMHDLLYGFVGALFPEVLGKPLEEVDQTRIPVEDCRKVTDIALPMFIGGD
ncbi:hypothetical protein AAFG07_33330 [Bradyrhizobium sp. B097]|uniref:hypothetical protein n=1 Tax=Bradyrhizobium sp. B097 TaxID=3140244 RepID=UPI0031844860